MLEEEERRERAQFIIDGAALLISEPERWTKGAYARDANGDPISIDITESSCNRYATCWCLGGAMFLSTLKQGHALSSQEYVTALGAVNTALEHRPNLANWCGIATFNDTDAESPQDLLDVLVRARERLDGD